MEADDDLEKLCQMDQINTLLDLSDLGAGYNKEDKRVARAIERYEQKLLPYIKENHSLFKSTNFLSIRGYGANLHGSKHTASDQGFSQDHPQIYHNNSNSNHLTNKKRRFS